MSVLHRCFWILFSWTTWFYRREGEGIRAYIINNNDYKVYDLGYVNGRKDFIWKISSSDTYRVMAYPYASSWKPSKVYFSGYLVLKTINYYPHTYTYCPFYKL